MENSEKQVKVILDRTASMISQCGPRPAGSEATRQAGRMIQAAFAKHCSEVQLEPFLCHPRAFLGYLKISASLSIVAALLLYFGHVYLAMVGYIFCQLINILEFGYYREFIDFLYPRKKCYNVIGRLEPQAEVKQQVIISGHHDSAYEFRFLTHTPWLYMFLIVSSTLTQWGIPAIILIWLLVKSFAGIWLFPYGVFHVLAAISIIVDLPFLFFLKKNATPGAGDNLVACNVLIQLAEIFNQQVKDHKGLQHTRLILASFDAEESGLRGSRFFAHKHCSEFKTLPTFNINLESLFDVRTLEYLLSDINDHIKLSRRLAKECLEISKRLGYSGRLLHMHYGYGATDAAELAKVGVEATSLVALNPDFSNGKVFYHTQKDTVENLDPKAVQAALEIVYEYIQRQDTKTICS